MNRIPYLSHRRDINLDRQVALLIEFMSAYTHARCFMSHISPYYASDRLYSPHQKRLSPPMLQYFLLLSCSISSHSTYSKTSRNVGIDETEDL